MLSASLLLVLHLGLMCKSNFFKRTPDYSSVCLSDSSVHASPFIKCRGARWFRAHSIHVNAFVDYASYIHTNAFDVGIPKSFIEMLLFATVSRA